MMRLWGTLLLAVIIEAAEALGTIGGSWTCSRGCEGGSNSHRFNFEYEHVEGSCEESIPYNATSVQRDVDVWCKWPCTQKCRTPECRIQWLACDNMHLFAFENSRLPLTDGCEANADARDLLREDCAWACKNGRPLARCTLHFDPTGRHGFRDTRLEECSISETCQDGAVVGVGATCQPRQAAPAVELDNPIIDVAAAAMLAVADPTAFSTDAPGLLDVTEACRLAIHGLVQHSPVNVELDKVTVEVAVVVRRRLTPSRAQDTQTWSPEEDAVSLSYSISSSVETASAIQSMLSSTTTQELAASLNQRLSTVGIPTAVQVTSISSPVLSMATDGALEEAHLQLTTATSLHETMERQLREAMADLNATSELLDVGNGTSAAAQAAHLAATQRLTQLLAQHAALQHQLAAARAASNATSTEYAQARAMNLVYARALSEAASALQALRINPTATSAQLAAAEAQHQAAQQNAANADAALEAAEERNTALQEQLRTMLTSQHIMEEQLAAALASLGEVREELWLATHALHLSREELRGTRLNLQTEIARWREKQSQTEAALSAERAAHDETRRERSSERGMMFRIIGGLCALVVTLLFLIFVISVVAMWYNRRIRKTKVIVIQGNAGPGDSIVMGNPVNRETPDKPYKPKQAKKLVEPEITKVAVKPPGCSEAVAVV